VQVTDSATHGKMNTANKKKHVAFYLEQESTDDVPVVLSVYEFDAKANLNHDDVESLLDQISKLPNTDGKTFETIAGTERNSERENDLKRLTRACDYTLAFFFQHFQLNSPTHQEISK
jgi:hypothetical protein